MRYVGLDLSLTGTGVCLLDDAGHTLRTIATTPRQYPVIYDRVRVIGRKIIEMLPPPESAEICIESPIMHMQHKSGQLNIHGLAFMARAYLYHQGYTWHEVPPSTLKKFIIGKGKGEKSLVLMKVYQNWDIAADDDNQADAAGLAHLARIIHTIRAESRPDAPMYQVDVARKVIAGK